MKFLFLIAATLIVVTISFLIVVRKRQYKYKPKQDYIYNFDNEINLNILNPIDLSDYTKDTTLVIAFSMKSNLLGQFFQPYVEIVGKTSEKIYLEHGLNGKRYFDVSGFVGQKSIKVYYRYCSPVATEGSLYVFKNPEIENKKILVLASHPDDAEIAAYGLYSNCKQSYIVTLTVGEGNCGYCTLIKNKEAQAIQKGRLRVHDSLTVASLGGVPQHRCVMLGYFCKTLKWMNKHPEDKAFSDSTNISDINFFRRVDHADFKCNHNPSPTWDSLVEDLKNILESIGPDLIVTPHPQIDSHSDHQYTTYALLEAMESRNHQKIPLLTYTNHHIYNDAYPYGEIFSTSALAPKFENPFICDGVYSYRLSESEQFDKFYALEAMHDLRNSLLVIGVKRAFKHFIKKLRRTIQQRDKSYYRRAVRPNELFYLTDWEALNKLSK